MAKPYKLESGRWRIAFMVDGQRYSRTFDRRKDAVEYERQARTDHLRGVFIPPDREREKVSDRLDAWLEIKQPNVAENTYALYELYARVHIKPHLGNLTMQHLTVEPIERWLNRLAEEKSSATALKAYQVMSSFLTTQERHGYTPKNWCRLIDAPKHTQREMTVLEPWELQRLVDAMKGQSCSFVDEQGDVHAMPTDHPEWELRSGWAADVVLGLALIGCRFGDLANLTEENLDRINDRLNIWDEKKDKWRWIPVFPAVREVLERCVARGGEYLFMSDGRRGQRKLWPAFNHDYFKPGLDRAGIDRHFVPHELRHTCASWLIRQGFDAVHVAAYLGHADPAITRRIYARLFADDLPDMGEALQQMVEQTKPDNVTEIRPASNE